MADGDIKGARLGFAGRLLRGLAFVLVHTVHRPKLYGEKPSLEEPTIFACRHVGLMDPVILMVLYIDKLIHPLAAKDYFEKNRFTRFFYPLAQCIALDRKNPSDKQWMSDSVAALERGESIIIFPEGRRNKDKNGLLPFHTGVAQLAVRSGARVIPVYNAFWKFPGRYRLAIGDPVQFDSLPADGVTHAWLRSQTEIIRDAVADLGKNITL